MTANEIDAETAADEEAEAIAEEEAEEEAAVEAEEEAAVEAEEEAAVEAEEEAAVEAEEEAEDMSSLIEAADAALYAFQAEGLARSVENQDLHENFICDLIDLCAAHLAEIDEDARR